MTDGNGNELSGWANHAYTAFGQDWGGSVSERRRFTGKERDPNTGLDYFEARYNSSSLGRFMTPDALQGTIANPQTLNRFVHVADNPLRFTDPTGMKLRTNYGYHSYLDPNDNDPWDTPGVIEPGASDYSGTGNQGTQQSSASSESELIAYYAQASDGSNYYAYATPNFNYPADTNKCNEFVADTIQKAGAKRPQVKRKGILGWLGFTRDPTAKEWATAAIPGWSAPDRVANARPGDVIAMGHRDDNEGHVGIVVGPGQTASADAYGSPKGTVVINDWGFRPQGMNGEHSGDVVVVRHYIGGDE